MHEVVFNEPIEELANRVSSVVEENIHSELDFSKPILVSPTNPSDPCTLKPSKDPVFWSAVNESTRDYFIRNGFNQNKDENFARSKRVYPHKNRFLNKYLFVRKLANGDQMDRDFLIYSPSQGSVFCGPCKLFCETSSQFSDDDGFSDWKHGSKRVQEHEDSTPHKDCVWTFIQRASKVGKADVQLQSQITKEVEYWSNLLKRVVAVIKKLSSHSLAFRGENDLFGSTSNGNYMMCLELIAEFDPFLKTHIQNFGNPGQGKTSYLSATICDELIEIMGRSVVETILMEVKASKYFSIIVDSTPDVTHDYPSS